MKIISLIAMFLFSVFCAGQTIQITDTSVTAVEGGINVNVQTISFNGAGYLSYDYTIEGNLIALSACYYFNMLAPVLTFDNDFFIPIPEPGEYTVVVSVYNSSSTETCDYFSLGGTSTMTILENQKFTASRFGFYPNPADDFVRFDIPADKISIFDMTGKLVSEQSSTQIVDIDALQDGIYLMRINAGTDTFTQKLIKQ